jgi:hypothetical protein
MDVLKNSDERSFSGAGGCNFSKFHRCTGRFMSSLFDEPDREDTFFP